MNAMINPIESYLRVLTTGLGVWASGALFDLEAAPPVIQQPPVGMTVTQNQPLELTVAATGTLLTYQWQKDGIDIPGATNAFFLRVRPSADNEGSYTVVVTNADGTVTSTPPAVVKVSPAPAPAVGGFYDPTFPFPVPAALQDHVVAVSGRAGYMFWGPTVVDQNIRVTLLDDGRGYRWGRESYWDNPQSHNARYITNDFAGFVLFASIEKGIAGISSDLSDAYLLGSGNINYQTGYKVTPINTGGSFVSLDGFNGELIALSNEGSVVNFASSFSGRQENTVIPTPRPAIAIAAGSGSMSDLPTTDPGFVVALLDDHSVFVWKYPDGSVTNKTGVALPIPAGLQSEVRRIAADTHGFAGIRNDGTMVFQPLDGSAPTTIPAQDGIKLVSGTPAFVLTEDHRGLTWDGHAWQPSAAVPNWVQGHLLGRTGTSLLISGGAPWIVGSPRDATVKAGESFRFEVDGGGSGVTYQWFHEGIAIRDATNAVLSLSGVIASEQGRYTVVLSNAFGSVTNAVPATLTVTQESPDSFELASMDPQIDLPLAMRRGNRQLRVGEFHVLTLGTDGAVRGWMPAGSSVNFGQATVPAPAQSGVVDIAAGQVSSYAVKDDGSLVIWGYYNGGSRTSFFQTAPARIRKASSDGNYFITADGGVVAFDSTQRLFVTNGIPPAAASGVIQVEGTYALKSDGTVISLTGESIPDAAKSGIVRLGESPGIVPSFVTSIGLKQDGTVIAWTRNWSTNYPIKIPGAIGLFGDGPTVVTGGGTAVRLDGATGLNANFIPQDWQGRVQQCSRGFVLLKPAAGFLRFNTPLRSEMTLPSIPLSAYSLRGLPVQFRIVSGPGSIFGSFLNPSGTAPVTVVAEEVNLQNPTDAESITRAFDFVKASQFLFTLKPLPAGVSPGAPPLDLGVISSSGLPVSYRLVSGPATLTGSLLTPTGFGTVVVVAEQGGNETTAAAMPRGLTFPVRQDQQLLVPLSVQDVSFGGPGIALGATANSGLPVRYTILSGPGTVSGGLLQASGLGMIQITVNQDGNDLYNPAPPVTLTTTARPFLQWKQGSFRSPTAPALMARLPVNQTAVLQWGTLDGTWTTLTNLTGLGADLSVEVPLPPSSITAPTRAWRVTVR